MPDRHRILSSPFRLTGGVDLVHLCTLVAADTMRRWAVSEGAEVDWRAATLAGDLASQHAAERELLREGRDRASTGRDELVERVRAVEAAGRADVEELLTELAVDVDLSDSAIDCDPCVVAARTAFVRLYESGLVQAAERVVDTCPRCLTVVEQPDADAAELDAELVCLTLAGVDGGPSVDVETVALELLPGVVAVAVPPDHPAAGGKVAVPLAKVDVPVIVDADTGAPALLVPAHDATALEITRRHALGAAEVLDEEGLVVAEGPLLGLGRYAARAAAGELLGSEGAVTGRREDVEQVARCRRCRTILVPRLGRHWFLDMHDLEVAAADVVREGAVSFGPAAALETFLARAGAGGEWCLSHQVEAGQPVPVATCLDCGKVSLAVEPTGSCGTCMGTLVQDTAVLDARFLGAVWPLAMAGWPGDERGVEALAPETTLVVSGPGVGAWAVPMAALGLRLTGSVPFSRLAVAEVSEALRDDSALTTDDLRGLIAEHGAPVVRIALAAGGVDLERAEAIVASVAPADQPTRPAGAGDATAGDGVAGAGVAGTVGLAGAGDGALGSAGAGDGALGSAGSTGPAASTIDEALADVCRSAYEAGTPSVAVTALAGAVADGVAPADRPGLRALSAPLLGS